MNAWINRAACHGMDRFLDQPEADQLALCSTCPVREQCADYSDVPNSTQAGTWPIYGGLTGEQQRQRMHMVGTKPRNSQAYTGLGEHQCPSDYHIEPHHLCYGHGCRCAGCRTAHSADQRRRRAS